jgi:hypothetical protein
MSDKEFFKALKHGNYINEHMLLEQGQALEQYIMHRLASVEGRLCALERGNDATSKRRTKSGNRQSGERRRDGMG